VTGRFRERFVGTLRSHPGSRSSRSGRAGRERRDRARRLVGSRGDAGRREPTVQATAEKPTTPPNAPPNATFPAAAYEACLTDDQVRAVRAFESLATPGHAVVAEADRGAGSRARRGSRRARSRSRAPTCSSRRRRSATRRRCSRERASELIEGSESDGEDGDGDGGNERNSEGHPPHRRAGRGRVGASRPAEAADLPTTRTP